MRFRKKFAPYALATALALGPLGTFGCSEPTIQKSEDLTGDGINDIIVDLAYGFQNGTWLYIGQKDGTYIRAKKYTEKDIEYFRTDKGEVYFFDGQYYKLSPQKK